MKKENCQIYRKEGKCVCWICNNTDVDWGKEIDTSNKLDWTLKLFVLGTFFIMFVVVLIIAVMLSLKII